MALAISLQTSATLSVTCWARVGDKWSILVIAMLSRGSMRFSELKRSLGSISQKVLTTTLRGLERDGYITREVTPSIPPRVDYELTELGADVLIPVTALAIWAFSRRADVEAARSCFDQQSKAPNLFRVDRLGR